MDKKLIKRLLDITYHLNLSHLSSNLTAIGIIDEIYSKKRENDIFLLSSGHAGLAYYCVLNKYYGFNIEELYNRHGTHPTYCLSDKIYCSSGSLGTCLSYGLGLALSDGTKNVYVLISDGECGEGIVYEVFKIKKKYKVDNLIIYTNFNGHSALESINIKELKKEVKILCPDIKIRDTSNDFPFINNVNGHYKKLTKEEYEFCLKEYA